MTHQKMTPRTANQLQTWMRTRVAQRLGATADEIDVDTPFMTLGLNSLEMVGLAGELAELLGREVSADVLWQHETIALLSNHFAESVATADALIPDLDDAIQPGGSISSPSDPHSAGRWSLARPIQSLGDRPPLFLPLWTGAEMAKYRWFSRSLGEEQPIYGLLRPAEQGETVSTLVAAQVDGLRSIQRKGPYHLGGFLWGGILAFEIARKLEQSGERVELLALFDVPFPGLQALECGGAAIASLQSHRPARYGGRIVYFQSEEFHGFRNQDARHWSQVCADFEQIVVPGSHQALFDERSSEWIARRLPTLNAASGVSGVSGERRGVSPPVEPATTLNRQSRLPVTSEPH
jgi:thioesterase domain-containing protein/acyl carrier protein